MVDLLLDVPGHYEMFSTAVAGDRELCFWADSVCKRIKNFEKYCKAQGTDFAAIKKAYKVAEGCQFLPKIMEEPRLSHSGDLYGVEISPLGHSPILRSEPCRPASLGEGELWASQTLNMLPSILMPNPLSNISNMALCRAVATSSPSFICWYSQSNNSDCLIAMHCLIANVASSRMAP